MTGTHSSPCRQPVPGHPDLELRVYEFGAGQIHCEVGDGSGADQIFNVESCAGEPMLRALAEYLGFKVERVQ